MHEPTIIAPSPAEVWLRIYAAMLSQGALRSFAIKRAGEAVEDFSAWKTEYEKPEKR